MTKVGSPQSVSIHFVKSAGILIRKDIIVRLSSNICLFSKFYHIIYIG